jgi:CubicO group peptidase (beta-lactamase class C family)
VRAAHRVLRDAAGTAFTGAVARVARKGEVIFEQAYGVTRTDGCGRAVYRDTRFDLASLTKLFVATCALEAVADGKLTLDQSLVPWLSEWKGTAHEAITLRTLLAHTSGMDSGADYRQLLGDRVVQHALTCALVAEPGERVVYSDLGFIALGELLQRMHRKALDSVVAESLGATVLFRPPAPDREAIPATEDDGWRGRVQGVVHDEKAYLMGGVAGHAGLFGSAADVTELCERYMGALHARTSRLPPEIAVQAVTEQADDPVLRRGLGWALKTSAQNSCGRWFSAASFGHTGFVGTCVWADPQRDLAAVLLTNAVYFGRTDTRDLRAAFYEAVIDDLALR